MAYYQFIREQKIPVDVHTLWDFMTSPKNLSKITPDYMGFQVTTPNLPDKVYEGMIIAYKVSPLMKIKLTWVTEITHVKDLQYFVDEQRVGPYSMWHHEHLLIPIENGVLMRDIVTYKPPFGILGRIANGLFIKKQLKGIFDYRHRKIEELYGRYEK